MSKSKYFGMSFAAMNVLGSDERQLVIVEYLGTEKFIPERREELNEALVGLVDTLRVTRKLLKSFMQRKGIHICPANEFTREMHSTAKKIDESPEDLWVIYKKLITELSEEMVAELPKKKK